MVRFFFFFHFPPPTEISTSATPLSLPDVLPISPAGRANVPRDGRTGQRPRCKLDVTCGSGSPVRTPLPAGPSGQNCELPPLARSTQRPSSQNLEDRKSTRLNSSH